MNFTQNTLNMASTRIIYSNIAMLLFRTFIHRKIAILSVTRHILRLSHLKLLVQPLITFTNKLMPLIFQYNFIANTFGLIYTVCKLINYYLERGNGRRG